MAPFNKRQIGYIQAIAGRQQHVTLLADRIDHLLHSDKHPSTGASLDNTDWASEDRPQTVNDNLCIGYGNTSSHLCAKSLLLHTYHLADREIGYDSRSVHNDDNLTVDDFDTLSVVGHCTGTHSVLDCFTASVQGTHDIGTIFTEDPVSAGELVRNPELIPSNVRATEDGFLNSTHVTFRFTLPNTVQNHDGATNNPMGQDHYEFRWIVFRNKRPVVGGTHGANLEAVRDSKSFRNYSYDQFMGQTGRKRGLLGYTHNAKLDKEKFPDNADSERYSGQYFNSGGITNGGTNLTDEFDDGDGLLTVDDLMTIRLNRDDYVVMKDVRFFLGKEHGKSHFEDTLHWDWNDPIETPHADVLTSPTLNDKNYRWKMMLIGTSGGDQPCSLISSVRWTTKMESG